MVASAGILLSISVAHYSSFVGIYRFLLFFSFFNCFDAMFLGIRRQTLKFNFLALIVFSFFFSYSEISWVLATGGLVFYLDLSLACVIINSLILISLSLNYKFLFSDAFSVFLALYAMHSTFFDLCTILTCLNNWLILLIFLHAHSSDAFRC